MKKNEIPDYVSTNWAFVNEEEEALITTKLARLDITWHTPKTMLTRYFFKDNFTYCLLKYSVTSSTGGYTYIVPGAAKRCTYAPTADAVNLVRGRQIALSRAVENLVRELQAANGN